MNQFFDVLAVNVKTRKIRLIGESVTDSFAYKIERIAKHMLGVDEEFFVKTFAGEYKNGDDFKKAGK